jgi:hypothetical protein
LARLVLLDLDVFMLTQFNEGQAISSLFLASFSFVSPQRLEIHSLECRWLGWSSRDQARMSSRDDPQLLVHDRQLTDLRMRISEVAQAQKSLSLLNQLTDFITAGSAQEQTHMGIYLTEFLKLSCQPDTCQRSH